ncbi:hypothetical protein LG3211_4009 [Lysobacter gummosus]|nr:hypothetical protein LG3211_4009 [Lysobacter gummosus]
MHRISCGLVLRECVLGAPDASLSRLAGARKRLFLRDFC